MVSNNEFTQMNKVMSTALMHKGNYFKTSAIFNKSIRIPKAFMCKGSINKSMQKYRKQVAFIFKNWLQVLMSVIFLVH